MYQHMVLQLEDCIDCLKVLYPQFDFLFLFDHSCRYNRQKEDGLNVENMNKEFGGAQQKLCNSTIQEQQGYLGLHSPILKPSDVQSMVFKSSDVRPFWMSPAEQQQMQHDKTMKGQRT